MGTPLDIIAIDAYPNYYRASPVYGTDVGDRIRKLKAALPNKPVIVMETGYPVAAQIVDQPFMFRFTEQRQASYFRNALRSTIEAGGEGFFYFGSMAKLRSDSNSNGVCHRTLSNKPFGTSI